MDTKTTTRLRAGSRIRFPDEGLFLTVRSVRRASDKLNLEVEMPDRTIERRLAGEDDFEVISYEPVYGFWRPARLRIRPETYRGQEGFVIGGRDCYGRDVSIFTTTRGSAEHIVGQVKAGQDTTLEDFQPRPSKAEAQALGPAEGWELTVTLPNGERRIHRVTRIPQPAGWGNHKSDVHWQFWLLEQQPEHLVWGECQFSIRRYAPGPLEIIDSKSVMGGGWRHEVAGPFFIDELPSRPRRERCKVLEAGAGPRGNARPRGTVPTLTAALEFIADLAPSTPADILAPWRRDCRCGAETCPCGPVPDRDLADIDRLVRLATPGTRLWVMHGGNGQHGPDGWGHGHAATATGLALSAVGALFGGSATEVWSVRWRGDNGIDGEGYGAVALEDARRAWWVLDANDRVVAGGPPIYDEVRAREMAREFDGRVQLGLGAADPVE